MGNESKILCIGGFGGLLLVILLIIIMPPTSLTEWLATFFVSALCSINAMLGLHSWETERKLQFQKGVNHE